MNNADKQYHVKLQLKPLKRSMWKVFQDFIFQYYAHANATPSLPPPPQPPPYVAFSVLLIALHLCSCMFIKEAQFSQQNLRCCSESLRAPSNNRFFSAKSVETCKCLTELREEQTFLDYCFQDNI